MMAIPIRKIGLALIFCVSSLLYAGAQPLLKTVVDKNGILIGEQVKVKITATMPEEDFFVKWIEIPDSLQHFEIVDKSKIDSAFHNQKLTKLSQTITFTSFDSGKWTIPAFNIDFNPSNGGQTYNLYTDTFSIDVSYQADTTNIIGDIKDIRDAKEKMPMWFWMAAGAGLLLLIGFGVWLYYYLRRNKKNAPVLPALSPYKSAMLEIDKLKQLDLTDVSVIKQYHSRLVEIFKLYLSSVQNENFESSTTGEVLMLLNQKRLDKDFISKTAAALRCSDAAKFAKYIPSTEESKQSWQSIKLVIDFIEQSQIKKEASGA